MWKYVEVSWIIKVAHTTPEGHSLWGTMLSYLIIVCFCPGELQYNPSTTGIFLVSIQYLKWTRQMLILGLACATSKGQIPVMSWHCRSYKVSIVPVMSWHCGQCNVSNLPMKLPPVSICPSLYSKAVSIPMSIKHIWWKWGCIPKKSPIYVCKVIIF